MSRGLDEYDYSWDVSILIKSLESLKKYALPVEVSGFGENLTKEQCEFFLKLADSVKTHLEEETYLK